VADGDGSPAAWSAAWVGVAGLTGGFGAVFWNDVATVGPRYLIWPACALSVVAVGSLYLCFAVLGGWWPARRLVPATAVSAAPTLIVRDLREKAPALPSRMEYQLSRIVLGPFLHTMWQAKVIGAENIPASGGAILAANHLSVIDSVFLQLMLDRPVRFAVKARSQAAQDILEAALALLREGQLFGMYPEGTRSPDGRLYRGRAGVGWLALKSGLPVIPVALSGTRKVLPPGSVVPRPGRIEVRIGKPLVIAPELFDRSPSVGRRLIADQVMSAIRELSGQEYVHMFAADRKAELAAAR
jgi:1-acyl-sn-glycerol-3-phosphate acyltransferase